MQHLKIADILTITRIFLAPVFILFFIIDTLGSFIVCFIVAGAIELTDYFDGKIARWYRQTSDFGKLMDPFADSISRFTIFLCFLSAKLAPIWIIAIFFYRDVLVSVVRVFSMKQGIVVAARKSGKTKAWVQALAIILVLAILIAEKSAILPQWFDAPKHITYTTIVIASAAAITLWSAIDYWLANKSMVILAIRTKRQAE